MWLFHDEAQYYYSKPIKVKMNESPKRHRHIKQQKTMNYKNSIFK